MKIMGQEVVPASVGLGAVGSVVMTAIVMSLGVWVFLDDRYAHAAEVTKATTNLSVQIQFAADLNEKRRIEDNLFRLEQVPESKRSDSERAQVEKYKRDLASLMRTWEQKGMPLK